MSADDLIRMQCNIEFFFSQMIDDKSTYRACWECGHICGLIDRMERVKYYTYGTGRYAACICTVSTTNACPIGAGVVWCRFLYIFNISSWVPDVAYVRTRIRLPTWPIYLAQQAYGRSVGGSSIDRQNIWANTRPKHKLRWMRIAKQDNFLGHDGAQVGEREAAWLGHKRNRISPCIEESKQQQRHKVFFFYRHLQKNPFFFIFFKGSSTVKWKTNTESSHPSPPG